MCLVRIWMWRAAATTELSLFPARTVVRFLRIEAAAEVAATGERLGRFALRMLLYFGKKDAFIHEKSVMVFGWRHLCQTQKLHELIEKLHLSLQTTEN